MSIQIEGMAHLFATLGRVEAVAVLEEPMQATVVQLQSDMQVYPPPPAGNGIVTRQVVFSTKSGKVANFWAETHAYVRTGTLGRKWTKQVIRHADGVTGRVGNNTKYGPYVQSSQFQAAVHQGRWQTDRQVLERRRQWIVERFRRRIRRALEGR